MNRGEAFDSLQGTFDVLVVGGGATGLGIALDAMTRGFRTAVVDAGDFAQATSSRATKLIHGGVRYLASGQFHLVYEALHERAVLMRNAPHLVHPQPFLLPAYKRLELPYYGAGLMLYDFISGKSTMGPTRILGPKATLQRIPNLESKGLSGSVLYHDGQFNDARLALAIARTAADHGATVLNYARCTRFIEVDGKLTGAVIEDQESGIEHTVRAAVIFNATGIFVDQLRHLDDPQKPPLLTLSRGTHIVVGPEALGGGTGIMVPKTRDGRVIFAIPWQGRVVIGTTEVSAVTPEWEPGHGDDEIDYLIETINPFLAKRIQRSDILSIFSGLRPLVTSKAAATSKLSREHHIDMSPRGLITVAGGKWTTYRRMAEDAINFACKRGMLAKRPCTTDTIALHGAAADLHIDDPYLREYGTDSAAIRELCARDSSLAEKIDPDLPYTFAQVLYAVRGEMARTLDDVLSRRTRALLLNSNAAMRAAPGVAAVIAQELGFGATWAERQIMQFSALARADYSTAPDAPPGRSVDS
jgi:glycerol-3-phosphate dehydrogenase